MLREGSGMGDGFILQGSVCWLDPQGMKEGMEPGVFWGVVVTPGKGSTNRRGFKIIPEGFLSLLE